MPIYLRKFYYKTLKVQIDKENEAVKGEQTPKGPKIDRPPQVKQS